MLFTENGAMNIRPLQIALSLTGNKDKRLTVCATQWLTKPEEH
jgi:hypothetical protein